MTIGKRRLIIVDQTFKIKYNIYDRRHVLYVCANIVRGLVIIAILYVWRGPGTYERGLVSIACLERTHSQNLPYSKGIGSPAAAISLLKVVQRLKLSRSKLKRTARAPSKSPMTVQLYS